MCLPLILANNTQKSGGQDLRKATFLFLIQVNVLFALIKWLLHTHTDENSFEQARNLFLYIFAVINVPTFTTYLEVLEKSILNFSKYLWRRRV